MENILDYESFFLGKKILDSEKRMKKEMEIEKKMRKKMKKMKKEKKSSCAINSLPESLSIQISFSGFLSFGI